MRYFEVLGIQHFVMYLFPAIAFFVLFVMAWDFTILIGRIQPNASPVSSNASRKELKAAMRRFR